MGSLGVPEPLVFGTLGARLRAHEGGSRDPGGLASPGDTKKLGGMWKGLEEGERGVLELGRAS